MGAAGAPRVGPSGQIPKANSVWASASSALPLLLPGRCQILHPTQQNRCGWGMNHMGLHGDSGEGCWVFANPPPPATTIPEPRMGPPEPPITRPQHPRRSHHSARGLLLGLVFTRLGWGDW